MDNDLKSERAKRSKQGLFCGQPEAKAAKED
jgi:hypothetical protein